MSSSTTEYIAQRYYSLLDYDIDYDSLSWSLFPSKKKYPLIYVSCYLLSHLQILNDPEWSVNKCPMHYERRRPGSGDMSRVSIDVILKKDS
ncbi:hypothetical protein CEXT_754011 [Caerostris extrusa]|uniref:Uncharacterized protein n=1 Tax=Caerostris extrusa TaxID=172846 RepID=A0AAV4S5J5_CAEEX|nr:hypothetical protein CEXT_754011 [Caerostris extrusa]